MLIIYSHGMQDTPLDTGDQGLYTVHVTDLGKNTTIC